MADYTESKRFGTNVYPVESNFTSNLLRRCEPILTPELLKSRYLKEVDLSDYTSDELKQEIELAVNEFELMSNLSVNKVQQKERIPFDRSAYKSFVYMKLSSGPILSIEDIAIESSNGEAIYTLPPEWIEMGFAHKRQINLIPILQVFGAAGLKDGQASNAGLIFIQAVNNFRWLPGFFSVTYTSGISHKEGSVPIIANDIIGMTAAIGLLSSIQVKFRHTSTSVQQDGVSQSAGSAGPQVYKGRIEELEKRREKMLAKIKAEFHQKYFLSNI